MKKYQIKQAVRLLAVCLAVFVGVSAASAQRGGGHHITSGGGGGGLHNSYSYARPRAYSNVGYGHNYNYSRAYVRPYSYARPYYYHSAYPYYSAYPRLGLRIGFLPFGWWSFYWGSGLYYYSNDVYYQRIADDDYEVVSPPIGASVTRLPANAKPVTINGNPYYEYQGTFYRQDVNSRNEVVYTIVGTNGVINQPGQGQMQPPVYNSEPQVGDEVGQLPPQCKIVYLNGQQYYLSPSNVFYQQITDANGTAYRIVGK